MPPKYLTPVRKSLKTILDDSSDTPPLQTFLEPARGYQEVPVEADDESNDESNDESDDELTINKTLVTKAGNSVENNAETKLGHTFNTVNDPNAPALLKEDPFSTETSRQLFEAIDELRKFGAGRDLNLPQLVIVGKQSAGKSSLLQSLTDIPFPVGEELCTRFATRIISRRTGPEFRDSIRVSIESGDMKPSGWEENVAGAEAFNHTLDSLTPENFADVIKQAEKVMEIDDQGQPNQEHFSSLVLKVEFSGPNRSHFGILDIPGYFTNPFKTSTREMKGVQKMITSYMQKPENIVICVADAKDDLANQDIFTLAAELVDGSRLVGVWTKCDVASSPEKIVSHILDHRGVPGIKTHWFAVQNRPEKATPSFDREAEERKTFSKASWAGIPEEQRGTANLKRYLADLLCRRIRESFPTMQEKVSKMLKEEIKCKSSLGKARETHSERLNYLMSIVNEYQDLAIKSLKSPGELPMDSVKLRGMARKLNLDFNDRMMEHGVRHKFLDIGQPVETEFIEYHDSDVSDEWTQNKSTGLFPDNNHQQSRFPHTPVASPNRNGDKKPEVQIEVHPLYAEIRHQIENNRGEELPGMLNPAVLRPLFREQISLWQELAEEHLNEIITTTTNVSLKLFKIAAKHAGMSSLVKKRFQVIFAKFEAEKGDQARQELLLQCHRNATMALQTTNPQFLERVRQARDKRFRQALERYHQKRTYLNSNVANQSHHGLSLPKKETNDIMSVNANVDGDGVQMLFDELHPQGRSQNVEDEIHDILQAYYDIALQNFITYVNNNIVEPFLNSETGPLLGLSTGYIFGLSEEEIELLGGEDETVAMERRNCEEKIKRLEKANQIATETWKKTREMSF